jgi:hypothetical protein
MPLAPAPFRKCLRVVIVDSPGCFLCWRAHSRRPWIGRKDGPWPRQIRTA